MLDQARMQLLEKAWDTKVRELIKTYERKGKKYHAFVRKLRLIDDRKRDKVLRNYYLEAKRKYIMVIGKWLKKLMSLKAVFLHGNLSQTDNKKLEGKIGCRYTY